MKPLAIDLFCGLGGWTDALLVEGYYVVGFDIERHAYGDQSYRGQLVIQDVLSLGGAQFRDAALIVASPPCQAYSYRAMPWKRAKALPPPSNELFDACFRIQREACEAAGRHIPLVVENVRGAQPWVGRARWNFGSFYLWGDVPALMPPVRLFKDGNKGVGPKWDAEKGCASHGMKRWTNPDEGAKIGGAANVPGIGWAGFADTGESWRNREAVKVPGGGSDGWFGANDHPLRQHTSGHPARKASSALIAKIPLPLSRHIAKVFWP